MNISEILNHLGEERDNYSGAVVPPIFQTVNFSFSSVSHMRETLKTELEKPFYTRGYNPTVAILRKKLAALEGAEDALVLSSGSAAVATAVFSVVKAGDHVICVNSPYSWTNKLISKYLKEYQVESTFVDGTDTSNYINAVKPNTKLIYLESPNSLTYEMQDLFAVSKFAKENNITTIIDNSYSSPVNQNPIAMGIDIVVHSATKYLNGHSDVVAGVVCSTNERIKKMMEQEYMTLGAVISPFEAWLLLRGLRTINLRVEASASAALEIAKMLNQHPKLKKVYYPFLESNPQFALAKKQMKNGGGLLSIVLNTEDISKIETFCNSLKCFLLATSWGGYESLLFPMCALAQSSSFTSPLPINMIRLYIGIENKELLKEDLLQALDKI